jgi:hypothetical protein
MIVMADSYLVAVHYIPSYALVAKSVLPHRVYCLFADNSARQTTSMSTCPLVESTVVPELAKRRPNNPLRKQAPSRHTATR